MNGVSPASVLVVDDEPINRTALERLLVSEGYETIVCDNGVEALALLAERSVDLILLDIMMPGMDGFELTWRLKQDDRTRPIPIIMVTTLEDRDSRLRALEAGAEEFLHKPADPTELRVRVRNLLRLKEYSDLLTRYNEDLEEQVRERTARLSSSYRDTILSLTRAAEYKDENTGAHIQRVSHYTAEIARAMGLPADQVDVLYHASPMHDVGKIGIPDHILLKSDGLTAQEWAIMRTHCSVGAHILGGTESPYLAVGAEIALSHHERWDGSGYPYGLSGESIPLPGRIMSICDVYDALRSKRPYKRGLSHETAAAVVLKGDGRTLPSHFDPQVLSAFERCARQLEQIYGDLRA